MMKNRINTVIMLFLLATVLFCRPSSDAYAESLDREQAAGLYTEATMMFRQANELARTKPEKAMTLYQSAVMRFERIVKDGGIENGKLYYNIGNAYFRMNDLGMAIVNYLRAERLTPDDPNLQHNLQYARSRRIDRIEEEQKIKVLKTLFFWHYDLSAGTRFIALAIISACFWITASLRIFYRKTFMNRIIICTAILLSLLAGSLVAEKVAVEKTQPGVIISPELTARKGNSRAYEPAFEEPLHAGTEFVLIEERENWLHVELSDSRRCWVPEDGAILVENT
jgi:tetratricopeptide repeat protein